MGKANRHRATKKRRGRRPIKEITEPQRRTLAAIRSLTALKGYPPTMRELAAELGVSPGSVCGQITQLIRKGYLRRQPHKARSLEVVAAPQDDPTELRPVKIVGDVAAGAPILAVENTVGEILVEARIVGQAQCFALKVKGDSMTGVGINDGDYCIVRQQLAAESGDIVVAIRGDEGTVKRLHISEKGVELRPENPRYDPIPIGPEDDDFRIVGKVVAMRRPAARSGNSR